MHSYSLRPKRCFKIADIDNRAERTSRPNTTITTRCRGNPPKTDYVPPTARAAPTCPASLSAPTINVLLPGGGDGVRPPKPAPSFFQGLSSATSFVWCGSVSTLILRSASHKDVLRDNCSLCCNADRRSNAENRAEEGTPQKRRNTTVLRQVG